MLCAGVSVDDVAASMEKNRGELVRKYKAQLLYLDPVRTDFRFAEFIYLARSMHRLQPLLHDHPLAPPSLPRPPPPPPPPTTTTTTTTATTTQAIDVVNEQSSLPSPHDVDVDDDERSSPSMLATQLTQQSSQLSQLSSPSLPSLSSTSIAQPLSALSSTAPGTPMSSTTRSAVSSFAAASSPSPTNVRLAVAPSTGASAVVGAAASVASSSSSSSSSSSGKEWTPKPRQVRRVSADGRLHRRRALTMVRGLRGVNRSKRVLFEQLPKLSDGDGEALRTAARLAASEVNMLRLPAYAPCLFERGRHVNTTSNAVESFWAMAKIERAASSVAMLLFSIYNRAVEKMTSTRSSAYSTRSATSNRSSSSSFVDRRAPADDADSTRQETRREACRLAAEARQ